jgi:hypothetical protein
MWNDLDCGVRWSNSMVIEFDNTVSSQSVLTLTDLDIEATAPTSGSANDLAATGFDPAQLLALALVAVAAGFVAINRTRRTR